MSDRADRSDRHLTHRRQPRDPDEVRVRFAAARADFHAVRELYLLELAVLALDDDTARLLELSAHEAYCDAHAITEEHGLDG